MTDEEAIIWMRELLAQSFPYWCTRGPDRHSLDGDRQIVPNRSSFGADRLSQADW